MNYSDREWSLVETRVLAGGESRAMFWDGEGTWAVCGEHVQPWDADAALTGSAQVAWVWFES